MEEIALLFKQEKLKLESRLRHLENEAASATMRAQEGEDRAHRYRIQLKTLTNLIKQHGIQLGNMGDLGVGTEDGSAGDGQGGHKGQQGGEEEGGGELGDQPGQAQPAGAGGKAEGGVLAVGKEEQAAAAEAVVKVGMDVWHRLKHCCTFPTSPPPRQWS